MNSCMISHATLREQDAAREEWFAGLDDRGREREEKKREQERQKARHQEWWGLDSEGRRVRFSTEGGGNMPKRFGES